MYTFTRLHSRCLYISAPLTNCQTPTISSSDSQEADLIWSNLVMMKAHCKLLLGGEISCQVPMCHFNQLGHQEGANIYDITHGCSLSWPRVMGKFLSKCSHGRHLRFLFKTYSQNLSSKYRKYF